MKTLRKDTQERRLRALEALAEALHGRDELAQQAEKAYAEARQTARRCLARDPGKTSGRLRDKLEAEGIAPELAGQVVREMADEGWQDEERAARRILRRHEGRRAKSRAYLERLLSESGIRACCAEKLIAELPPDQESIMPLIPEQAENRARLIRRLQGRGYALDTILRALREKENVDEA